MSSLGLVGQGGAPRAQYGASQRTPDGSSFLPDRESDADATLPMRTYPQVLLILAGAAPNQFETPTYYGINATHGPLGLVSLVVWAKQKPRRENTGALKLLRRGKE